MSFLKSIGSYVWVLALSIFAAVKMFYVNRDTKRFKKTLKDDVRSVNKRLRQVEREKDKVIQDRDEDDREGKLNELDGQIKKLEKTRRDITKKHLGPFTSDEEFNKVLRKLKSL